METLITALAPAFAVGLALQALIEWADSPIEAFVRFLMHNVPIWWAPSQKALLAAKTNPQPPDPTKTPLTDEEAVTKHKKAVIRTISVIIGIGLASYLQIHVLQTLNTTLAPGTPVPMVNAIIDTIVSGLVISLGTDGVNQIVKFVEQAKDNQQADAQKKA